jgi:3-dehydroquinate synthase
MRTIRVHLGKRSYPIYIGSRLLGQTGRIVRSLSLGDCAYIVTNARIKRRYGRALATSLQRSKVTVAWALVGDTEQSKSLAQAARLITGILKNCRSRRVFIVALGGGVIGDLAGFVAAVYKRGVPYIQIPTTLLAQVDSSIGGKTALDLPVGKNLIGVFYQPRLVICDTNAITSLPLRQIIAGMAEIIKYAVICDPIFFKFLEKKYPQILAKDQGTLAQVVSRCASIKARIVERDEQETRGLRTILNFGHTLGHAIETAGGYRRLNHGEAVALGMVMAVDIGVRLRMMPKGEAIRIERLLKSCGATVQMRGVSLSKVLRAYVHDKKFVGRKNKFVLLRGIGKAVVRENIPLGLIADVVRGRS